MRISYGQLTVGVRKAIVVKTLILTIPDKKPKQSILTNQIKNSKCKITKNNKTRKAKWSRQPIRNERRSKP